MALTTSMAQVESMIHIQSITNLVILTALRFLAQVVNKRMQVLLTVDPAYQAGLLATKYQRVYFTDGTVKSEELPDTRFKLPIGARLNYFAGNKVVIRTFYRYYQDNWGVKAHTFELETPIKMTPF
jgi:hypothetical protein